MKTGLRYSIIGTLMTASVVASIGMAQMSSAVESLEHVSDRYGLWAALTVGLVGFSVWMYYRESTFTRTELVGLIQRSIKANDNVGDSLIAIRDELRLKPCLQEFDSEKFDESVDKIKSRREAKDKET